MCASRRVPLPDAAAEIAYTACGDVGGRMYIIHIIPQTVLLAHAHASSLDSITSTLFLFRSYTFYFPSTTSDDDDDDVFHRLSSCSCTHTCILYVHILHNIVGLIRDRPNSKMTTFQEKQKTFR